MELSYITDTVLRRRIEDSIEYIYALHTQSKQIEISDIYRSETYRVIIVYVVAIIEALLFYIYQQRNQKITKIEYKEKIFLNGAYCHSLVAGNVIVAVQKIIEKTESEIGLKELVEFLGKEKVLKEETLTQLLAMLPFRNSVHLRQKNTPPCTIKNVETTFDFLLYIITHTEKYLK